MALLFLKGQLISKANCVAEDSSKKWTNEFVFTSMRRVFIRFLEESSARQKTFRNYLTFRMQKKRLKSYRRLLRVSAWIMIRTFSISPNLEKYTRNFSGLVYNDKFPTKMSFFLIQSAIGTEVFSVIGSDIFWTRITTEQISKRIHLSTFVFQTNWESVSQTRLR